MIIYTVKSGDTLQSIGREYGLSPERIALDNRQDDAFSLVPGQTLVLLFPALTYTVEEGDTLLSVAERFGTDTVTLYQNNPVLSGEDVIFPGQTLVISYGEKPLGDISLNGYAYTYIDDSVLSETLPYLTYLSVFSYGINPDGTLIPPDNDERLIAAARKYGATPIMMLTSLSSDGKFSSELINTVLSDDSLTEKVITEAKRIADEKGYGGVEADFEYISPEFTEKYAAFVRRLGEVFGEDYTVFVDLAPKVSRTQPGLLYEAHDYSALGDAADIAFLMTYEWGYKYGPPLAVSPIPNVRRVVEFGVTEVSPEKILMGIPSYGYDWTLPYVRGESVAETLSSLEAVRLAARVGADIMFDENAKAPYFNYTDRENREHIVWFQDAKSAEALLTLAREFSLSGIGIWNIMRLFPELWLVINGSFNIRKNS